MNYLLLFLFHGWVLVVARRPTHLADWLPALITSHARIICIFLLHPVCNVTFVVLYTHTTI